MSDNSWALSQIWNDVRDVDNERSYEPRNYIWASELGQSFYDRYWKMKGRKPTTPPNLRAQRKFDSGNLTEWVVQQMLRKAHIYKEGQARVENEEGDMKVTGKADHIAGGQIQDVTIEDLPEVLGEVSEATLAKLKEKYPTGLAEQVLEIKSVSNFAFPQAEKQPYLHHALQTFHYAYNRKIPGHLIYINRDDLRMVEYVILPSNERWKRLYFEDIEQMALVFRLNEEEVLNIREPLLLWDEDEGKFKKNIKVEYSAYLTDYGFERPDQYADGAKVATRLNNVVKSIKNGKKLSKLNLEAMEIGRKFYPPAIEKIEQLIEENKEEE